MVSLRRLLSTSGSGAEALHRFPDCVVKCILSVPIPIKAPSTTHAHPSKDLARIKNAVKLSLFSENFFLSGLSTLHRPPLEGHGEARRQIGVPGKRTWSQASTPSMNGSCYHQPASAHGRCASRATSVPLEAGNRRARWCAVQSLPCLISRLGWMYTGLVALASRNTPPCTPSLGLPVRE